MTGVGSLPDDPGELAGRFAGRAAIVTGAARGIGRAIAARLVREGARVAVLDVDGDAARTTVADLGERTHAITVDLAQPVDANAAVDAAARWLGGIDILVNNAGVFAKTPLRQIAVAEWDRVLAVNARAVLLAMQAALPWLEQSPAARVVNIASMAARRGTPGEACYAASKAAVLALTRVAAQELGPCGVTVNAVCPGYVLTELGAATRRAEDVDAWTAQSPLGRLASVHDVAGAVTFLASDDAAYLTGQAVDVSGGMVML